MDKVFLMFLTRASWELLSQTTLVSIFTTHYFFCIFLLKGLKYVLPWWCILQTAKKGTVLPENTQGSHDQLTCTNRACVHAWLNPVTIPDILLISMKGCWSQCTLPCNCCTLGVHRLLFQVSCQGNTWITWLPLRKQKSDQKSLNTASLNKVMKY